MRKQFLVLVSLVCFLLIGSQTLFAQEGFFDAPDEKNESWMFFSPTAYVNTQTHSLDVNLWMKDLGDTEVRFSRLRYDIQLLEAIQLGVQSNADADGGHHSSYFSAKYTLLDRAISPVAVALGIRKRLHWNDANSEFETGKSTDDTNKERNSLTLIGAATGEMEFQELIFMGNLYLDNQTVGLGGKVELTPNIKAFLDGVYNYYDNAVISGDSAVGVQFYNLSGLISTLSYQTETEQFLLAMGYNW